MNEASTFPPVDRGHTLTQSRQIVTQNITHSESGSSRSRRWPSIARLRRTPPVALAGFWGAGTARPYMVTVVLPILLQCAGQGLPFSEDGNDSA